MNEVEHQQPLVLLDRDGTLNRNFPDAPVYNPERFELLPGAARGVRLLNDAGLRVVIVTNQGGIRHRDRDFCWTTYRQIEAMMHQMLDEEAGAHVDGVFVCPHADYEGCTCRKPEVGLLEQAFRKHPGDIHHSFLVGDRASDIRAGRAFGVRTILVESGWESWERQKLEQADCPPHHVAPDLHTAATYILRALER